MTFWHIKVKLKVQRWFMMVVSPDLALQVSLCRYDNQLKDPTGGFL